MTAKDVYAKTRFLSSIKLLIIVSNIQISRRDSALLNSLDILDGAKDFLIPFTESLAVLQSIVKLQKSITWDPMEVEYPDKDLPDSSVKGWAGI